MLPILAQSADWVVISKPSGLAVHRSPELHDPTYLVQVARNQFGRYVWPVHRLDRATSGCLWLAFRPEVVGALGEALAAGQKRYLALVRGKCLSGAEVVITNPMKDSRGMMREATTQARCIGSSLEPRCSLVLASPQTGRFHQIRRHLRDIGHPVIGDGPHGDSRVNRLWREEHGMGRVALHCLSLSVVLPEGPLEAVAPIPDDLRRVWARLPWWDDAVAACPELSLKTGELV